jgi:hypothetical protein
MDFTWTIASLKSKFLCSSFILVIWNLIWIPNIVKALIHELDTKLQRRPPSAKCITMETHGKIVDLT